MELHVQSWFTIDLAAEAAKGNVIASFAEGEADLDSLELGPRQFLLEVMRSGPAANPEGCTHVQLRADSETDAKVRDWIAKADSFKEAEIALAPGESLVRVRGESCSCTSHGIACVETCPYY